MRETKVAVKEKIKSRFGFGAFERLRAFLSSPVYLYRRLKSAATWRGKVRALSRAPGGLRLHLGCSNDWRPGMLNCEYRPTKKADVIMDCSRLRRFRSGTVSAIYSHAFFEHLYRDQRTGFLKDAWRALGPDGVMVTLGLPDFETIARCYIEKSKGATRPFFDLFEVYRYTHGTPEESMCWLPQLHKSLFDRSECIRLWQRAGFRKLVTFGYRYRGEDLAVSLGVVAYKGAAGPPPAELLAPFQDIFENLDVDLGHAVTTERPEPAEAPARVAGGPDVAGRVP